MLSLLENVPWALEKVHSSAFGWNVLKISMRSISSKVSFKAYVFSLIFCFDDLSIGVSGMLKSPTMIVLLSISSFVFLDHISPFNIYCKAGLVVLNSLNFCLSEKLFISPSILNEILAGYLIVDFSLSVL